MECRAFTTDEDAWALRIGTARHERSFSRDVDSVYAKDKATDLAKHVMGARAELAYCILEGVTWTATVDAHRRRNPPPDVPPDIEIRCHDWRWDSIIVRDKDVHGEKAHRRFVMARQRQDGIYEFEGWLYGMEATRFGKTDKGGYGKPAWFLTASQIHRLPFYRDRPGRHKIIEV